MSVLNPESSHHFLLGVIEGFYGRSYSWQQRQQLISFLAEQGYHAYCYAPKSQRQLRMDWRHAFAADDFSELKKLSEAAQSNGIAFGLGFSPWGLQPSYEIEDQKALQKKIEEINRIGADWLCVLFDDMPGDGNDLAERQLQVMHDVLRYSSASLFAFCPTYYSHDPVLEKLFGIRPGNYWRQLGDELPGNVDVFWTGNQVVSASYSAEDFSEITAQLKRKPMLWDNYPVNDGRVISNFLHLDLFPDRSQELQPLLSGHIVNPMNQFYLSLPVLSALPAIYAGDDYPDLYQEKHRCWKELCLKLGGQSLFDLLERDKQRFQYEGLTAFSESEKQQLAAEYRTQGSVPALEVADWLSGGYAFDPACLTD
jgi:hyaluronoglucosaminidase